MRRGLSLPLVLAAALSAACSSDPSGTAEEDLDAGSDDTADVDWEAEFDSVFQTDRVPVIRIDFHEPGAFDAMVEAAEADPDDTPYYAADFAFDDETVENVGVRLKGNSSLWSSGPDQRKSFKVHFEEFVDGQRFHHVDRLNLHNGFMDPSLMRESLAYGLANDLDLVAPRSAHALVYVDGELHGLFTMVQQIDSRFLAERFGEEDDADEGNLYKCCDGCPLAYWGDDPAYYQGFPPEGIPSPPCDDATDECGLQLKTNEDDPETNDLADVVQLTKAIDDVLQGDGDTATLEAIFDVEHFVRFQAWSLALSNLDSYFGSAHNFYLYRRPTDGRFQFVPWDVNLAYGTFECPESCSGQEPTLETDLFFPCFDETAAGMDRPKPLAAIVATVPEYRDLYCDTLRDMLETAYTAADQREKIEALDAVIGEARQAEAILTQPPFDFTCEDYVTAQGDAADVTFGAKVIHALDRFNQDRIANIEAQLDAACP